MSDSYKRIVLTNNGSVYVGWVDYHDDGTFSMHGCRKILRWGTTQGLSELRSGPTANTIHAYCIFVSGQVILSMDLFAINDWDEILKKGRAA